MPYCVCRSSHFVVYFGVGAVLDPLLILLVDLCAKNFGCASRFTACSVSITDPGCHCHIGDAFKLYEKFVSQDGSGVVGIILVVLVDVVLSVVACTLLYTFIIKWHLNGRLLDLYHRLVADDTAFSWPLDVELSLKELQAIVARAQKWTGARGTKRRVAVCEYTLVDPLDAAFAEVTTHVVIYTATVDGSKQMYRQFLRLPDGTIMEVFDDAKTSLGLAFSLDEL